MQRREVNPTTWLNQFGIHNGIEVSGMGRVLFMSGQTATTADGEPMHPGDLLAQFQTAWSNLKSVLADAGMDPENIVRLMIYTTDPEGFAQHAGTITEMVAVDGAAPTATLIGVTALFEPTAMIELEATAIA